MGYIEDNLMDNEKIIYKAKLHWIVFLGPVLYFILAILFFSGVIDGFFNWMISSPPPNATATQQQSAGEEPTATHSDSQFGYSAWTQLIHEKTGLDVKVVAGWIFLLIALIMGASRYIKFRTSEIGITNRRVIIKVGFIRRDSVELLLDKVESVMVHQGILGRLLDYGTLAIVGTGGTGGRYGSVENPMEFRKTVHNEIEKSHTH